MDERDAEIVVNHLHRIEKRLDEMDRRLRLLEPTSPKAEPAAPSLTVEEITTTPPPPVIKAPAPPTWDTPQPLGPPSWHPAAPQSTAKPTGELKPPPTGTPISNASSGDDLEYKIGRIGLLWAGAVVVIIGIIYLVGLAAARNALSPQVRFAGELALCATFIVVGFFKRNEREDFGQLLTGIGSCGLYLAFAGGHVYKGLYSSEVAVGLFAALSLANLGYAAWRSSRSFLAIGMIGGLVSAMLPMHAYNAPLDVGLHFLILVPCALIVAKNKWVDMASWLWVASTLALLPVYTYANHLWLLRVGALYMDALVCAAAYAYVHKEWELDPKCWLPFAIVATAGIGGVAIEGVKNGSLHVFALAAGAAALGWVFRERALARNSLYGAALAVAVTLAPLGYTRSEAAISFALLSLGLSLASTRLAPAMMRSLAYIELGLATCAYLGVWMESPPLLPFGNEVAVLISMMAAVVTGAICAVRTGLSLEGAIGVGAAAMLPLFERFGNLFLTTPSVGGTPYVSAFFTTLTAFAVLYAFARWRKLVVPLVGAWLLYVGALDLYMACTTTTSYSFNVDLTMLGCLIFAAVLLGSMTASRLQAQASAIAVGTSATTVGFYVLRLSFLVFPHFWNFSESAGIAAGACLWTLIAVAVHQKLKLKALIPVAWIGLCILLFTVSSMDLMREHGLQHEASLTLLAVGCAVAVTLITVPAMNESFKQTTMAFCGLLVGSTWMRFVYLELTTPKIHFAYSQAIAVGAVTCLLVSSAVFYRYRHPAMAAISWAWLGVMWIMVVPTASTLGIDHGGYRFSTPLLLLVIGSTLLVVRMTASVTKERNLLTAVPVLLEWTAFTRLCVHTTHLPGTGDGVVSLAWTTFAVVLICLGFGYRAPYLRYWALAVFATVVGKVFMVDLASVDSAVRVAILLFLGICMVGAGYGYVRWRQVKPVT